MSFSCVAFGSINQANFDLFNWSRNAQCVANSACALAWKFIGGEFSVSAIDEILMSGDRLYRTLRHEDSVGGIVSCSPMNFHRSYR